MNYGCMRRWSYLIQIGLLFNSWLQCIGLGFSLILECMDFFIEKDLKGQILLIVTLVQLC